MNPRTVLSRRAPLERPAAPPAAAPIDDAMIASDAATGEANPDQDVIERAIEQALDSVRAELEAKAPRLIHPARAQRTENVAAPAAAGGASQQRTIPRARIAGTRAPQETFSPRRALMSSEAGASVSSSFDDLARAMISGNAPKLDEMVEEILRPMLKTWLEGNLPQMVERMVREEIERVSRGRR